LQRRDDDADIERPRARADGLINRVVSRAAFSGRPPCRSRYAFLLAFMLKLTLDRIDKIREHVISVAIDRVVDILLGDAVPFGKALQDFAELRLGLATIGVELFQPVAR
jgi:hypothetical protein